jgi:hypothetical protein
MNSEHAWRVVQVAFKASADLQELLHFLKQNCTSEDYKGYSLGIAASIDAINVHLLDRALKAHPKLRTKIESDLARFGRIT